jgi:hypothetical protein
MLYYLAIWEWALLSPSDPPAYRNYSFDVKRREDIDIPE